MQNIKKYFMTLALLLTAVTGAWAEGYYNININFGSVYNPEFTNFMCDVMGPDMPSGTLNLSIDNSYTGSFRVDNGMYSGEISPALDAGDHTWYAEFIPEGGGEKSTEQRSFTIDQDFAYVYIDDPGQSSIEMGVGESRNFRGHVDGPESSEVNISSSNDNVAKFRASSSYSYGFEGYIDAVGAGTATITVSFAGNKNYKAAQSKTLTVTVLAPAPSGPEVAWNKATKTGTFTMPAGNVELQVEYYPGMLVKPTSLVGGTLSIEGLTDTTLPEGFEKDAEGNIYVAKDTKFTVKAVPAEGYHLVGWSDDATNKELEREFTMTDDDFTVTATFSDAYDIAFNAANANTIESGKATVKVGDAAATVSEGKIQGVKAGQTVTLTAATGYKFRKAEVKKGGGEPVLLTTITAADNSSFESGSQTFGDVATVTLTGDYLRNDGSHGGWYCQSSNTTATISVAAANGANITSVKFYTAGGGSAEDKEAPFEVTTTTVTSSDITTYLNGNSIGSYGVSKIEVYGTK